MLDSNGTTVLGASEQDWAQRQTIQAGGKWTAFPVEEIANDNRVNETRTYLDDNGVSVAKVDTLYDQTLGDENHINNPVQVDEYDFDQTTLQRRTTTSYFTGGHYTGSGVNTLNLLTLALVQSVYEASDLVNPKARSTYEYDNYTADGNHQALASYSDFLTIPGHNSNFNTGNLERGNATKVTRMVNPTTALDSYTRYDVLGNVVSVKDPKGNESTISYLDDFGTGSNPGFNANPHSTYALPTLITSPPPNPGEPQQTAFSQYDYATGLLTGFKDRNGIITQSLYNDPFDRPTLIKSGLCGSCASIETHTAIYYAGLNPVTVYGVTLTNNDVLTAKDQTAMDDGNLRSWTHTDGFGRTLDQFARDAQGDVRVTSSYDGLGRAKRVSNPYRSTSDPTYGYADTSYDLLGRVTRVESFDGGGTSSGAVTSSYSGARVLVTDQAGKQRLSQSDGLGRLLEVWEIRTADAATEAVTFPNHPEVTAGYRTKYSYDGLDDLLTVKQQVGTSGTLQTRTFVYDGLKRLVSASNPESGLVQYSYDPNSNLQTKTDARVPAVTTTYAYDALNRVKTRTYSDSTPGVSYGYEKNQSGGVVANAIGRLTFVSSAVSTSSYNQYDELGRVLQSAQTTQAGTSQSYALNYEYNRAGALTAETYPSLKKYVTSYDSTGRLSEVKEQTQNKTYANGMSYTAHGAVAAMTLGNGLIEKTAFNTRLQPTQIKLGTAGSPASVLQLDYGYGTTSNNGNVVSQTISVPTTGGTAVMTQSYGYDGLNRLQSMSESNGGWTQTYGYDRFGNRWVAAGNVPSPQMTPQTQAAFNPATNKIDPNVMTGFGYDAVGNVTSDPTTAANGIVYDAENRQVSYTKSGVTTSYSYDGDGRRVKKVTSGSPVVTTVYVYDIMGRLVAEYTDSSQQQGSGTKYLTADHLGSTRVVTGQNQTVMARYDYLPYGEEMGAGVGLRTAVMGYSANENTRQKFTLKERDTESGLDYFLARYYSSAQGRFTSVDPIALTARRLRDPQQINLYSYVRNNPLNLFDPDGENTITVESETYSFVVEKRQGDLLKQVKVTVTETTRTERDDDGNLVSKQTFASASAANTDQANIRLSADQLKTVARVASVVVEEAGNRGVPRDVALGIAARETFFGTNPRKIDFAFQDPKINPMQLTTSSGKQPTTDLRLNVMMSLDLYKDASKGRSFEGGLQKYGPGPGNPGGATYAEDVKGYINQIRGGISGSIRVSQPYSRQTFGNTVLPPSIVFRKVQ